MKVLTCLVALTLGFPADFTVKKLNSSKTDYYNATVEYLEFSTKHSMARTINPILKNLAVSKQATWLKSVQEMQKGGDKPISAWELEVAMTVEWNTPRLVTVVVSKYDYSGGAHPNHGLDVMNFGVIAGKSRQLKLADFFAPRFNSSSHISKLVIAKLKKVEGADWVQSGNLKALDSRMLNRFTPSKSGLTWHFNPYDVGPYAAGDFEVTLTIRELGPKFKKAMLAGS